MRMISGRHSLARSMAERQLSVLPMTQNSGLASRSSLRDSAKMVWSSTRKTLCFRIGLMWASSPDVSRIACCDRETGNPLAGLRAQRARILWPSFGASSGVPSTWELVLSVAKEDKLTLRRTVQGRLGSNPLRLPCGQPASLVWRAGTAFSTDSRRQFVRHPGWFTAFRPSLWDEYNSP